jgi:TrmH family RNA methyltransferase
MQKLCYTQSMLTKGKIVSLKSLSDKKERSKKNVFIVEGEKSVAELLLSEVIINELFITTDFAKKYEKELHECGKRHALVQKWLKPQTVEVGELNAITSLESLKNPCSAFAVADQFKKSELDGDELTQILKTEKVLVLDEIRDPGNMGTIIRLADWYGIKHIIASIGTVDIYNPKTISASMGSFSRVTVIYKNIEETLNILNAGKIDITASVLDGENANGYDWPKTGALIIGNESGGIGKDNLKKIKNKITLPSFGKAESLNASIACAVLLDRWTSSN